jgi:hypothetical protein
MRPRLPTARLRSSERGRGVTATLCRTDRATGRTSDLLHVLAWASVLPFTRDSVRLGRVHVGLADGGAVRC